jgi:hypothetical protein
MEVCLVPLVFTRTWYQTYPGVKTRGITLLLRNHSHLEGMCLRPALTATFWVRYPRGYHL